IRLLHPVMSAPPPAATTSAATTVADPQLVDHLSAVYSFQDDQKVRTFLRQHPFLVPLLVEAREVIPVYFGRTTPVSLEVVVDPEAEGDPELYAQIHTSAGSSEALQALRGLDEEWWLGALDRARCLLTITVRHI
ncbi:MAG: hypothetical protein M3R02_26350, partial [Chloroflexota bacterium]|nr:hypothetical protein [Chloroflexota bacterium]